MTTVIASAAPLAVPSAAAADDLRLLMSRYPIGGRWQFHGYHPASWPRNWRRKAEQAQWGMRAGDLLEVTGYGNTCGFSEGLLMDRLHDGTAALLFPTESDPAARESVTRPLASVVVG